MERGKSMPPLAGEVACLLYTSLHSALRLREPSALCGEFFLEVLLTLCTQLIPEHILAIGDIPKQDLQKFQHALFQNNRTDEVLSLIHI